MLHILANVFFSAILLFSCWGIYDILKKGK